MKSKIQVNLLCSLSWIEQEDDKMSTPPCCCLEYKAQCLYSVLRLNRGVDCSLPALEETANDSSCTMDDTSQSKPLQFVLPAILCSYQSEKQMISLC